MIATVRSAANTRMIADRPHRDLRRAFGPQRPHTDDNRLRNRGPIHPGPWGRPNGHAVVLGYGGCPPVSADRFDAPRSAVFESSPTMVVVGTLAKACAWYDNEWGCACCLVGALLSGLSHQAGGLAARLAVAGAMAGANRPRVGCPVRGRVEPV